MMLLLRTSSGFSLSLNVELEGEALDATLDIIANVIVGGWQKYIWYGVYNQLKDILKNQLHSKNG